jgi:hypothetical protein
MKVAGSRRDVWVLRAAPAAAAFMLRTASCILLGSCCLLLVSCAPQIRPAGPDFSALSLDDALTQYRKILSITTIMGIEYEKNEAVMSGDGSLFVSPDKLLLRIYYLGFLQGEVLQENGEIKSKPKIDKIKSELLVQGLKSSIFWWNISAYERTETDDTYELRNQSRKIIIDKRSLLPVEQTLTLDNGDQLLITYGRPVPRLEEDGRQTDGNSPLGWYPSRLKIQLRNYTVRIEVKSYTAAK